MSEDAVVGVTLFSVDVLPAGCKVTAEMEVDTAGRLYRLRFVAYDAAGRESAPSGWFDWEGEEIVLVWSAFEFPEAS